MSKSDEKVENAVEEKVEIASNLNISEDVIGVIAGLAASEVEGIAGMLDGKKVTIDIFVNVKYGVRIPDVAWAAQTAVKNAVENMTGLEVETVNINVQDIIFEKEEKKDAKVEMKADEASNSEE